MYKTILIPLVFALIGCKNEADFTAPNSKEDPQSVVQDFPTSEKSRFELQFDAIQNTTKQELTLANEVTPQTMSFTQQNRPQVTRMFQQASAGKKYLDNFVGTAEIGVLDLLVVIDNSGSMSQEQVNLSTKLEPLLSEIKDSNWQIGVVTTDPADPCLRGLIKKGDPNATAAFKTAIEAGIAGTGNEQGIRQAVTGLKCEANPWVRPNSTVGVLIVSDEDNCSSNGIDCAEEPWNRYQYLTNFLATGLANPRTLGVDARIYGLIYFPGTVCPSADFEAVQYGDAILATGGTYGSICAADYSQTLKAISKDVATLLKSQFELKQTPDAGSATVTIDGVASNDFQINGKILQFNNPPPKNAAIQVNYVTGRGTFLKDFDLQIAPASSTVVVKINNAVADPKTYQVAPGSSVLTFTDFPPPDSQIQIDFRENLPLEKSFEIGNGVDKDSIKVSVNEKPLAEFIFDQAAGKVDLNQAPIDASLIKIEFSQITGPQLYYPTPSSFDNETIEVFDIETNQMFPAVLDEGTLSIDPNDFVLGKKLAVVHYNALSKSEIDLPQQPIPETLIVQTNFPDCSIGNGIILEGTKLFVDCSFEEATLINIEAEFLRAMENSFSLPTIINPEVGIYTVKVDGVPTLEFTRTDRTIVLREMPELGSVITVEYKSEGK